MQIAEIYKLGQMIIPLFLNMSLIKPSIVPPIKLAKSKTVDIYAETSFNPFSFRNLGNQNKRPYSALLTHMFVTANIATFGSKNTVKKLMLLGLLFISSAID
jgi:hypothetical protein